MKCRFCGKTLENEFVNLGSTAISNAFLEHGDLNSVEAIYPLNVLVCDNCFLVQVGEYQEREKIFTPDYVYFSSVSDSWLKHCEDYANN
ncbi:MAG: SAM-dependent methyltransferase, partial [Gammaproteobacteria bacterium]|nr:SAM-dependent methyltransferase [Gammaproteobacteria bacterium]